MEWFAHAALHGQPGLSFQGCDGLRVFHPVLVRENHSTLIQVFASSPVVENGGQRIAAELHGQRANGQSIVHSRGEIIVGGPMVAASNAHRANLNLSAFSLDPDDIYQRILFHGPNCAASSKSSAADRTAFPFSHSPRQPVSGSISHARPMDHGPPRHGLRISGNERLVSR